MRTRVFVYGALRKGASNSWRMEDAEWLGAGSVFGTLVKVSWYPRLVLGGKAKAYGEVYETGRELLANLDTFEGVGQVGVRAPEYERRRVEVTMESGESLECWFYEWLLGTGGYEVVQNGDWLSVPESK